jgi:hypothetical protein
MWSGSIFKQKEQQTIYQKVPYPTLSVSTVPKVLFYYWYESFTFVKAQVLFVISSGTYFFVKFQESNDKVNINLF